MRDDDCILLLSSTGRVLWASRSTTEVLGYSSAELLEMSLLPDSGSTASAADFLGPLRAAFRDLISGAVTEIDGKACLQDKFQHEIALQWKMMRLPFAQRDPDVLLVFSESLSAERGVRGYRDAFENATAGFFRWGPDGRMMELNLALAESFGYRSPAEMMSKGGDIRTGVCSSSERYSDLILLLEDVGHVKGFELEVLKADGTPFWVGIYARAVREANGQIVCFEGCMFEITRLRRAEQESQQSRNHLRALTARLHDVREEERTGIARELHDELGRDLTLLTLDLAWLRERLVKIVSDDVRDSLCEKISTMEKTIQMTLQTVRRILSDLRPPLLDELGLKDAIEFQVQEFSKRVGIRYEFNATPITVSSDRMGIAVFRIFQEVLTNVARHAKASRIKVDLVESNSALMLIVEDNGCGISQARVALSKGFGILGIRERAWSIGGEVEIHETSHSGTRVTLRVPLTTDRANTGPAETVDRGALKDSPVSAGSKTTGPTVPQAEFPFGEGRISGR